MGEPSTESEDAGLPAAHRTATEPFYVPTADEVDVARAAYANRIPIALTGPTGCGKTRFVEHLAWRLGQDGDRDEAGPLPVVTVACHEDLTASDLIGRYLLKADGTEWLDGPLTQAARGGGICYLDEIVEARKDTTVVLHSLTDHRRVLPLDKLGTSIRAHDDFLLIVSYNPGYQSSLKELKQSTRQRFISIAFGYPDPERETRIIAHEAAVEEQTARRIAQLGSMVRNLDGYSQLEGPSTRLLIYAGRLINQGLAPRRACEFAIVQAMTDDGVLQDAIREAVNAVFE